MSSGILLLEIMWVLKVGKGCEELLIHLKWEGENEVSIHSVKSNKGATAFPSFSPSCLQQSLSLSLSSQIPALRSHMSYR